VEWGDHCDLGEVDVIVVAVVGLVVDLLEVVDVEEVVGVAQDVVGLLLEELGQLLFGLPYLVVDDGLQDQDLVGGLSVTCGD